MNINKFEELKSKFGSNVVWKSDWKDEEYRYCFSMNDELGDEESFRIEDKYEFDKNISISVGYGDDILNCVSVKVLEDMDEDIEEFVLKYVGSNCYSEE